MRGCMRGDPAVPQLRGFIALSLCSGRRVEEEGAGQEAHPSPGEKPALASLVILRVAARTRGGRVGPILGWDPGRRFPVSYGLLAGVLAV